MPRTPSVAFAQAVAQELGFVLGGDYEIAVLTTLRTVRDQVYVYKTGRRWVLNYEEATAIICGLAELPQEVKPE